MREECTNVNSRIYCSLTRDSSCFGHTISTVQFIWKYLQITGTDVLGLNSRTVIFSFFLEMLFVSVITDLVIKSKYFCDSSTQKSCKTLCWVNYFCLSGRGRSWFVLDFSLWRLHIVMISKGILPHLITLNAVNHLQMWHLHLLCLCVFVLKCMQIDWTPRQRWKNWDSCMTSLNFKPHQSAALASNSAHHLSDYYLDSQRIYS